MLPRPASPIIKEAEIEAAMAHEAQWSLELFVLPMQPLQISFPQYREVKVLFYIFILGKLLLRCRELCFFYVLTSGPTY